ncbi:unnamed protein product [Chondrus crispus]|uniref:Uncharacterized protein n=1 Tax=Chondrus crispus TaxID=2769 RepID=R7Q538_CHOCR|nr:unnamed protein product [Chondrus crispus]CDF33134.1 unnamed protein product [Chondrus crispus]|eukprot:XP_005712937.1 unnamed protein product [Chondrus crispus]
MSVFLSAPFYFMQCHWCTSTTRPFGTRAPPPPHLHLSAPTPLHRHPALSTSPVFFLKHLLLRSLL